MSIRNYADTAIEQGKLATEQANQIVGNLAGRAAGAVGGLRAQAERALPLDTVKSVVEPYVEQARKQAQHVGHRAEGLLGTVREKANRDPRLAKAVATAETVAGALAETVQDRVVKPVASLTGLAGNRTGKPAGKPTAARKPATTRPATKKATAKPAAAKAPAKSASKRTTKASGKTGTEKSTS